MRLTWTLLILVLACATKHQEAVDIKSKPTYDSLTVDTNTKSSVVYDSLSTGECHYTNLSREFEISTTFTRFMNKDAEQDSCVMTLLLTDKATRKVVDRIQVTSGFLLKDVFMVCENVMSYSTKFNTNMEVIDNYYGDLIVADVNFDSQEDIAVTNDSGGNGGTLYSYFIQTDCNTFVLDKFLTDSMTYFPIAMNKQKRTLMTYVRASSCEMEETIYQLDAKTSHWKTISRKMIDECDK